MCDALGEFRTIVDEFPKYRALALQLQSPNAEDDEFVRAGIVGFSRFAPPDQWARGHYEFIKKYREGDYSNHSLEVLYGDEAQEFALLACLCLGCLLGLFQVEKISDSAFRVAEAQLPGFMALHARKLSRV